MKPDKFIDAMGHLDESIIDEYNRFGKGQRTPVWVKYVSVAASVAVVLSATLLIWRHGGGIGPDVPPETVVTDVVPGTGAPVDPPHVTHEDFAIVSVEAEKTTGNFISGDTDFVVKTEHGTAEDVRTHLYISTAPEYNVIEIAEDTFQVHLEDNIADNTVVSLSYVEDGIIDQSWAFQTEGKLSLSGSYPRDGATTAPVNSVIELEFSYSSAEGVEDAVTFEPEITGTWEHAGRIWRFSPDEELAKDTTYKIYVGNGITAEGKEIEKTATVTFSTYEERAPYNCTPGIITVDGINSYLPNSTVTMRYSDYSEEKAPIGSVTLEKFEEYTDMIAFADGESVYDSTAVGNVEFDTEIIAANDQGTTVVNLTLAETLDTGYYIARVYAEDDSHLFDWIIQVNPMSVYAMVSERDVLIWVAVDGEAAADVPVEFTDIRAKTDEDGTLLLKDSTDGYGEICYLIAGDGDTPFVLGTPSFSHENYPSSYIYSDKPQYRSTDTVKVWGMIPVDRFYEEADGVFAVMIGDEKDTAVEVVPDENGTFMCEVELVNHAEAYPTSLNLTYDGTVIGSRRIYVSEYSRNNYSLSYSVDQRYIETGKDLEFKATMTHVSGIAVAGKTLTAKIDGRLFTAVTDKTGTAHFVITPDKYKTFEDYGNMAQTSHTVEIELYMNDPEDARYPDGELWAKIMKTPVDAAIRKFAGDEVEVELFYRSPESLSGIDGAEGAEYEGFGGLTITDGRPYGTYVNLRVDILKITRDVVRYENSIITGNPVPVYESEENYSEEIVESHELSKIARDGRAVFDLSVYELPEATETEKYRIEFSVEAYLPAGFALSAEKWYLDSNNFVNKFTNYRGSSEYADLSELPGVTKEYYNYGYYVDYAEDESEGYVIKAYDGSDIAGGKIMYFLYSQGIHEVHLTDPTNIVFDEDAIDGGSFLFGAVYFKDGVFHRVRSSGGGRGTAVPDYNEDELTVEVTSDANRYEPGANATVTVQVTDSEGDPVKGAAVNVSVVEDYVFNGFNNTRITETIYRDTAIRDYFYSSYTDYSLAFTGLYGRGSELGPDNYAPNFGNTAYFGIAVTDEDGKCTVGFTVPEDSVTEYRITVHAATRDLRSGEASETVEAASDFIVQPGEVKFTKITDDLVIPASLLTAEPGTAVMNFRLNELDLELNVNTETGKMTYANFGKIPAGDYTVTITTVSDSDPEFTHTVTVPVSVSVNTLEITESHTVDVTEELEFEPSSSPVTMKFFNEETERYGRFIRFIRDSESERFDALLADTYAYTVREKLYGIPGSNRLSDMEDYMIAGSDFVNLSMLEDGDPDAILTALYMYITGDRTSVYGHYVSDAKYTLLPEVEMAESLLIRAAAGEAVLVDLRYAASEAPEDPYVRAILSLALSMSGDTVSAKDLLTPMGDDATEGDRALYCAALVFVDRDAAGDEIDRLMAESPEEPYLGLAASLYMKTGEGQIGELDSVTVICGDDTYEVSVKGLSEETLILSVEEGATIRFENATEGMRTGYSYQATFTPKEDENNVLGLDVTLTEDMSVASAGVIRIGLDGIPGGGKAKVALPSSLRYDSPYYGITSNLVTAVAKDGEQFIEIPVTAVAPGHYILEPVIYTVNGVNYYSDVIEFTVGVGDSNVGEDPETVTTEPAVTETETAETATEAVETARSAETEE